MKYKVKIILSNKVLIKKDKPIEKTEGGLFLPLAMTSELNQPSMIGTIVAVGDGLKTQDGTFQPMEPTLKLGVRVVFTKNELTLAKELGDDDLAFIPASKILAVIED